MSIMPYDALCENYANALYRSASNIKEACKLQEELEYTYQTLCSDNRFFSYFTPLYDRVTQNTILIEFLSIIDVSIVMVKFFKEIINNGRIKYIGTICSYYKKLVSEKQNIKQADIYTATKITSKDKKLVLDFLYKQFNYNFHMNYILDSSLIGGIKIMLDSKVIELSVGGGLLFYKNLLLED